MPDQSPLNSPPLSTLSIKVGEKTFRKSYFNFIYTEKYLNAIKTELGFHYHFHLQAFEASYLNRIEVLRNRIKHVN